MSEVVSDVLEDMLRTELTRQGQGPQPDPDHLLHRVRITRRRTTTMTSAAVMVLVIVVSATVWTALPRTGEATVTSTLPADAHLGQPPALWFADPDHGYALLHTCPGTCQVWLAVTTDGGRSWHGHTIRGITSTEHGPRAQLRGLDTTTVVIQAYDGDHQWYTSDSGNTWSTGATTITGNIDHIPAGAAATVVPNAGAPIDITVLTTDGNHLRLTTPPPLPITTVDTDVHFAADGSAWIRGSDDRRSWIMVSRDRGRTWHEIPLPDGGDHNGFDTHDGHHLYYTRDHKIWRKTGDDGPWQPLDVPATPPGGTDTGMATRPQPDGGLLITDITTGLRYYAPPTATTFQPTGQPDLGRSAHGARQLRGSGPKGMTPPYAHSADGHIWTPLPF